MSAPCVYVPQQFTPQEGALLVEASSKLRLNCHNRASSNAPATYIFHPVCNGWINILLEVEKNVGETACSPKCGLLIIQLDGALLAKQWWPPPKEEKHT